MVFDNHFSIFYVFMQPSEMLCGKLVIPRQRGLMEENPVSYVIELSNIILDL